MAKGIVLTEDERVLANKLNLDTDGVMELRLAISAYDAERADIMSGEFIF